MGQIEEAEGPLDPVLTQVPIVLGRPGTLGQVEEPRVVEQHLARKILESFEENLS